jgi:hypothetical protein
MRMRLKAVLDSVSIVSKPRSTGRQKCAIAFTLDVILRSRVIIQRLTMATSILRYSSRGPLDHGRAGFNPVIQ